MKKAEGFVEDDRIYDQEKSSVMRENEEKPLGDFSDGFCE